MLKMIVDKQILVIVLGVFTAIGIASKCIVNGALSRLVRAAGNMNKSNHPLMRLVRAKFEHACMVSEKVDNVEVFVDKYLYEYRVLGIRLHSLRRLEKAAALLCIVTGLLGAASTYSVYGMNDRVLQVGVIGAGLGVLVYVFHLTTDENYRLQMVRNYMVDYLQNVCLRRYEKAYQKDLEAKKAVVSQAAGYEGVDEDEFEEAELKMEAPEMRRENMAGEKVKIKAGAENKKNADEPLRPHPGKEVPSPQTPPEVLPPAMPEPYSVPETIVGENSKVVSIDAQETASEARASEKLKGNKAEEPKQKPVEKEILIRQILEEFMA